MTGRDVGSCGYPNFFHSSGTRCGSWNAFVVLQPPGHLHGLDWKTKLPVPAPPSRSPRRTTDSHEDARGGSGAFRQSAAPRRLGELIGFAYEDHSAEIQATAASKFPKFLFSLKNSLISWEDSLACNAERKVILPAEACFIYNVLERRLFVFSAAENSSGCRSQCPCRNRSGEVRSDTGC